jgi:hypothetical protein
MNPGKGQKDPHLYFSQPDAYLPGSQTERPMQPTTAGGEVSADAKLGPARDGLLFAVANYSFQLLLLFQQRQHINFMLAWK